MLRRLGADLCDHSLVISRARLIARLQEALEHPDWKWEAERRRTIRHRVEATRLEPSRRSMVPVTGELRETLNQMPVPELATTIELLPGKIIIRCHNMEHLLQQLVQLAKTLDNDYETCGDSSKRHLDARPAPKPPRLRTTSATPPSDEANQFSQML